MTISIVLGDGAGNFQPIRTYINYRYLPSMQKYLPAIQELLPTMPEPLSTVSESPPTISEHETSPIQPTLPNPPNPPTPPTPPTPPISSRIPEPPTQRSLPLIEVGDFNDDGKVDLAVANYFMKTLNVYLGNGDGSFQSATNYDGSIRILSMTASDFNMDGRLDLAVADYISEALGGTVSILFGSEYGYFHRKITYHTRGSPSILLASDMNNDKKTDLAVAFTKPEGVDIYTNLC
ncbi:hypothetical protein I4U23_009376 [Adineta vaga]|nr:hypothetical protein I4U23_009376 [Adineta vaga]